MSLAVSAETPAWLRAIAFAWAALINCPGDLSSSLCFSSFSALSIVPVWASSSYSYSAPLPWNSISYTSWPSSRSSSISRPDTSISATPASVNAICLAASSPMYALSLAVPMEATFFSSVFCTLASKFKALMLSPTKSSRFRSSFSAMIFWIKEALPREMP